MIYTTLALASLDLAVIGACLPIVAIIDIYVARGMKTGDDLFLAGRPLGWDATGLFQSAVNTRSAAAGVAPR